MTYTKYASFRAWTTRVSNPVCYPRFRVSASVTVHVAVAGERPDAADHRDLHVSDALEESLQKIQVEDRLRDDIFGAGFHFPVEAADLFVHVQRAGVGSHADQQGGL